MRIFKPMLAASLLASAIAAPAQAADPVRGKMLYNNTNDAPLSCATAGCHGPDPLANNNGIRKGANPTVILDAIRGGVGAMALFNTINPATGKRYVEDPDAADIAAYIANPASGTQNPAATLSPTSLGFGSQVVQTTSAMMSANLTNTGTAKLVLSAVTLGVGGTNPNPADFTRSGTCAALLSTLDPSLAPAASCSIDVTFKPTAIGARTATITIGHNATQTSVLSLSGTGAAAPAPPAPAAALSATTIAFGDQTLGTPSASKKVSISNTGTADLRLGTITTNAADFAASNCSGSILVKGASCEISVTFTPAELKPRTATLSIPSNAVGSPHGVALSGSGVAAPAAAVLLNPTSLAFGNQTVGTTSTAQGITLTFSGNAAPSISSIEVTGTGFAATHNCVALAAAASCTINVTFTPASANPAIGAVKIISAAAGSPHTVGLSGTGTAATPTAPVATLTPAAVDFSMVTLNTPSATRDVVLKNTGNAPLNLTALNVTGTNGTNAGEFSQTNNCPVGPLPLALAAGANCTISTRFTPAAAGTRAAKLSLTSNAAGSPAVDLKGTGMVQAGAVAQVTPSQTLFGNVRVGRTSDDRKVSVRNTGTTPLLIGAITVSGDFLKESDCESTLPAGKSCEVNVKFKPTAVGPRAGDLTIASNAAGAPHVVKLSGVGVNRASRREKEKDDDDEDECDDGCSGPTALPFSRRRRD